MISHFHLPSAFLSSALLLLIFFNWKCLLGFQAAKFNCDCTSGISGHFCLLPTAPSSTTAVLQDFSGCGCLLPIQVQLQLYFRTTQAQLCTTNSRATVYYLEFILFYLVILATIWLQNILFLPLAYLILRLLSLELHPLSQKHPLLSLKLHRLS